MQVSCYCIDACLLQTTICVLFVITVCIPHITLIRFSQHICVCVLSWRSSLSKHRHLLWEGWPDGPHVCSDFIFLYIYIDMSLSSVINKALQPLGWRNAFWMFPHTHSLPHLLTPPLSPPCTAGILRTGDAHVSMWQKNLPMIPFSVLTVLLSSLKVLRTWWWATKVWVLFLTPLFASITHALLHLPSASLSLPCAESTSHPPPLVGFFRGCIPSGLAPSRWMVWSFPLFPSFFLSLSVFLSLSLCCLDFPSTHCAASFTIYVPSSSNVCHAIVACQIHFHIEEKNLSTQWTMWVAGTLWGLFALFVNVLVCILAPRIWKPLAICSIFMHSPSSLSSSFSGMFCHGKLPSPLPAPMHGVRNLSFSVCESNTRPWFWLLPLSSPLYFPVSLWIFSSWNHYINIIGKRKGIWCFFHTPLSSN